jgi:hypothetical protein
VRQLQSIQSREAERLRGLPDFSLEADRRRHGAGQLLHLTRQPFPHSVDHHADPLQFQPIRQEGTPLSDRHAQAAPPVHEKEELIDYSDEKEELDCQPAPMRETEEEEVLYDYGGPFPEDDGEPVHQPTPARVEEEEMIDWFDEESTQPPAPEEEKAEEVICDYGGWSDEKEPTQLQSESPPPPDPYNEESRILQQRVKAEDRERERQRAEEQLAMREYAEHSIDLNNHPFYLAHRSGRNSDTSHRTAIKCSYDEIEEPGQPFIDNSRAARNDRTNPQRSSARPRAPTTDEESDDDIVKAFIRRLSTAARRFAMQGFRRDEDIDMEEIGDADDTHDQPSHSTHFASSPFADLDFDIGPSVTNEYRDVRETSPGRP